MEAWPPWTPLGAATVVNYSKKVPLMHNCCATVSSV